MEEDDGVSGASRRVFTDAELAKHVAGFKEWQREYQAEALAIAESRAVEPEKVRERRKHFVRVPLVWRERLNGATGHTILLALDLLYLHWKGHGAPFKLPNGMLKFDGISRQSKWRGLNDLERRGLIAIERRPNRSPNVRVII
jgi:hypothetical protein